MNFTYINTYHTSIYIYVSVSDQIVSCSYGFRCSVVYVCTSIKYVYFSISVQKYSNRNICTANRMNFIIITNNIYIYSYFRLLWIFSLLLLFIIIMYVLNILYVIAVHPVCDLHQLLAFSKLCCYRTPLMAPEEFSVDWRVNIQKKEKFRGKKREIEVKEQKILFKVQIQIAQHPVHPSNAFPIGLTYFTIISILIIITHILYLARNLFCISVERAHRTWVSQFKNVFFFQEHIHSYWLSSSCAPLFTHLPWKYIYIFVNTQI